MIVLMAAAAAIESEIAMGVTQIEVAKSYALALRVDGGDHDWARINRAIVGRWSVSGLTRIKTAAWTGTFRGAALFGDA